MFEVSADICDWRLLGTKAAPILKIVERDWRRLLMRRGNEESYHSYLSEHAGLFFGDAINTKVVASKVRLSPELTTDFVIICERYSEGASFQLVELELPHLAPFTTKGNPSQRLYAAIQQIENWRAWIKENRTEAKRLFPSIGARYFRDPNFTFTIVIGTRENTERWLDRRNQLARDLRIEIRSFDYLTDLLRDRVFLTGAKFFSTEQGQLSLLQRNELANPFYKAYTDSDWRRIVRRFERGCAHFAAKYADILLSKREYNRHYSTFLRRYGSVREDGIVLARSHR